MPADRCDLDHTIDWPHGPTSPTNLRPLCRTHHRVKTLTDTTHQATTDDPHHPGGHHWTMPSGHTYTRPPEPALEHPGLTRPTPASATRAGPTAQPDNASDPDPPSPWIDDPPPF